MEVIKKPKVNPEMMSPTELIAYVKELEKENKRLEELYQKSAGLIAMYPTNIKPKTNREKIMQMSVKDFLDKYASDDDMETITSFVVDSMRCSKCPRECGGYFGVCYDRLSNWLNEELKENNESCE